MECNDRQCRDPDATRRVLVVDDISDFADALQNLLISRGYTVEIASTAEQALKVQEAFDPDIAIVDIRLGATSGLDLVAALKQRQANLACITLTAYAELETAVKALRVGVDDYLLKPLDSEELFAVLERCFHNQHSMREKKGAEDARHESEQRKEAMVANIPGMDFQYVQRYDGTLQVLYVSGAIRELYEYEPEEYMSRRDLVTRVVHPDDWARYYNALIEAAKKWQPCSVEFRAITKSGNLRWVRSVARPRRLGNGDVLWNGVVIDITGRRQTEEESHTDKATRELDNHAETEFLANMSHELRTPLNAVIGFSEIIRSQLFGPVGSSKYVEYANNIYEAGGHLLQLVNDILDHAKIENGKLELVEDTVDVARMVRFCLAMVKERAQSGDLSLECDVPPNLPGLRGDERKLKQVLLNLLSNAIKFTPAGGKVTLEVATDADRGFVFSVADTGIGIAPEDVARAMAPFGQVDGALSQTCEGTGLGLPLTKALVELHGGMLNLESEVGVGTSVTVCFPAWRVEQDAA